MLKTTVVAISFLTISAAAVNAANRSDLESGYHGNTPVMTYLGGPKSPFTQTVRGAFAKEYPEHPRARSR